MLPDEQTRFRKERKQYIDNECILRNLAKRRTDEEERIYTLFIVETEQRNTSVKKQTKKEKLIVKNR